jgi:ferrous iron transport protein A
MCKNNLSLLFKNDELCIPPPGLACGSTKWSSLPKADILFTRVPPSEMPTLRQTACQDVCPYKSNSMRREMGQHPNPTCTPPLPPITLRVLKKANQTPDGTPPDACCPDAETCPLSSVEAGTTVCIKQLTVQPDVLNRLREMGLGEEQRIRLISRHPSLICQVCNARVALSNDLAKAILVEPLRKAG